MAARNGIAGPSALFLAYLEELPLRTWLEAVGTNQMRKSDASGDALNAALQRLDPAAVFSVRNGVLHALARFESDDGRRVIHGRVAARFLRPITERSALAVLARGALKPADFATLYAPFEIVIPPALLFGIG